MLIKVKTCGNGEAIINTEDVSRILEWTSDTYGSHRLIAFRSGGNDVRVWDEMDALWAQVGQVQEDQS